MTSIEPARAHLVVGGFPLDAGALASPGEPGLGIEIDPDALKRYTVVHRTTKQGD